MTAVLSRCLAAGLGYGVNGLLDGIASVHEPLARGVFALLGLVLLVALGFEFVNGFHDTANAVANGSGLQWSTVRSTALAWVITLPVA